tara:strand:+ start:12262 stop:13449 length:1188 start_codon:yes stop_codon:yes gene_type:complete
LKKNNKIDLVILAGGQGTRIKKFLKGIPKPLYKFNNVPFLQLLINHYAKYPFENIYIMCGYKADKIYKTFHNQIINFVKIKCFIEKKPLGTGGALNILKKIIKNDFFLVNGDSFFNVRLNKFFFKTKLVNTIFLTKNNTYKSNNKLSKLSINHQKKIYFSKKGNMMNAGIYFFKKKILSKINRKTFSLENDIIPNLIKNNDLNGIYKNDFFIDIGTQDNLKKAQIQLPVFFRRPSAFLDRDGVINYDYNYVYKIKDFKFKKNILKSLKYLCNKNFYVFIVTNQAGIAKKKFSLNDFFKLHKYLKHYLNQKYINFDSVEFCPYHKNGLVNKFRKDSVFRKPNNGMIKKINRNWFINHKKSFFIGDQKSDEKCAKKSKLYFEYPKKDIFKQIKNLTE